MNHQSDEPHCGKDAPWQCGGFLPKSYLFSIDPVEPTPANLREIPLPSGHLFLSPDYYCCVRHWGSGFMALIGHCIDLAEPSNDEAAIVLELLRRATEEGIDAMLAHIDDLFGRFAAVCRVAGDWCVFADACATRTVYFAEDRPAIASHSTMLGDLIGGTPRMEIFQHYWCALPGNASPVAGVRVLPANFALDLASRRMRRFWPRTDRNERAPAVLIDELDRLLDTAANAVAARWKPILSLTAGLDSRLSLSVYHRMPDLVAFTYHRDQRDTTDVEVARRLCERLGIEHRRLVPVEYRCARRAYELIEAIPDCTFDKSVAPIYLDGFQGNDPAVIHVRSSLAEIGRAFWRYHPGMPTTIDPDNWTQVSLARATIGLPKREEAADYMRREMRRFFQAVGYASIDPRSPEIRGYDVWDLVYMEHRMSTWHAQALLGSDMTFDTSILFNSRRILDLLMAVPLPDRRNATLFRMIIARRCPQLSDIPINPRPRRTFGQLAAGAYRQVKRRVRLVQALETRLRLRH
ncbi:MAG: hypothetical protein R3D05_09995 [Dongiaceae bacterium]